MSEICTQLTKNWRQQHIFGFKAIKVEAGHENVSNNYTQCTQSCNSTPTTETKKHVDFYRIIDHGNNKGFVSYYIVPLSPLQL